MQSTDPTPPDATARVGLMESVTPLTPLTAPPWQLSPLTSETPRETLPPEISAGGGIGEIGDPAFTVTVDYSHGIAAISLEHHPQDSRIKVSEDGKVQTLSAKMGTGGNNVPLLMCAESEIAPHYNSDGRQLYTNERGHFLDLDGAGLQRPADRVLPAQQGGSA
jgi:hypothetical protein